MDERKVISNGIGWIRYIVAGISVFLLAEIINNSANRGIKIIVLLFLGLFFYLLKKARRLQYDKTNFYIIHGQEENVIPFSSVISVKKSNSKINGRRFWKLRYKDGNGNEHTCRFFLDFFYNDLLAAIKEKNPEVVIWTHPFFNH